MRKFFNKGDYDKRISDAVSHSSSFVGASGILDMSRQSVSRASRRMGLNTSHFSTRWKSPDSSYGHGDYLAKKFCECGREISLKFKKCSVCDGKNIASISDDEVKKSVASNSCYLYAARQLRVTKRSLVERTKDMGLDTSHFVKVEGKQIPDEMIFSNVWRGRFNVRERYFNKTKDNYFCEVCGQKPEWNGYMLKLELDHISGDKRDNRLENLRWICPNCHTQQSTYCGFNYHRYGN